MLKHKSEPPESKIFHVTTQTQDCIFKLLLLNIVLRIHLDQKRKRGIILVRRIQSYLPAEIMGID